eukprot:6181139-Pleurochrysis_carterae.AAC.2
MDCATAVPSPLKGWPSPGLCPSRFVKAPFSLIDNLALRVCAHSKRFEELGLRHASYRRLLCRAHTHRLRRGAFFTESNEAPPTEPQTRLVPRWLPRIIRIMARRCPPQIVDALSEFRRYAWIRVERGAQLGAHSQPVVADKLLRSSEQRRRAAAHARGARHQHEPRLRLGVAALHAHAQRQPEDRGVRVRRNPEVAAANAARVRARAQCEDEARAPSRRRTSLVDTHVRSAYADTNLKGEIQHPAPVAILIKRHPTLVARHTARDPIERRFFHTCFRVVVYVCVS